MTQNRISNPDKTFNQMSVQDNSTLKKVVSAIVVFLIVITGLSIYFSRFILETQYRTFYLLGMIFLFFLLWIVLIAETLVLNPTNTEIFIIKKTVDLILVLGLLTAYFAVIIENKAFSLLTFIDSVINNIGVKANLTVLQDYFYAVVIPIIEELTKIFPVIILFGNYIRIPQNREPFHTRLLPSQRIVVLYGGVFGAWFDLFEQIMIFSNTTTDSYSFLLFHRTIFPLHTTTSMLAAFGLSVFFVNRQRKKSKDNEKTSIKANIRYVLLSLFLIASIAYHSLWNFFVIANFNQDFLLTLGYGSYFLLFVILIWALIQKPGYCSICHTEHKDRENCPDVIEDFKFIENESKKARGTYRSYSSSNRYLCPSCSLLQFNGEYCEHCWSFPKLECNNCNQLVPVFSRICWSCGAEQDTLYEKIPFSSPPYSVSFAVGFTRLLVSCFFISFLFTLPKLEGTLNSVAYSLFYITINSVLIVVIAWYAFKNTKIKSMIASVIITSCVLITFGLLAVYTAIYAIMLITSIIYASLGLWSLASSALIILFCVFYLYRVVKKMHLIYVPGEIYEKYKR
ncbi:MAG: hypothetical protein ACTSYD_05705 [Candidatus Heimdallarchaeaceae archaeon]